MIQHLTPLVTFYDTLDAFWERHATQRAAAAFVLFAYFAALIGIELKHWGIFPEWLAKVVPDSHSWAILLAFTLILAIEIISLIFCISASFSRSVGKQLEILALIQLRSAFKELGHLQKPIAHIAIAAAGPRIIFIALRVFLRVSARSPKFTEHDSVAYVHSKKLLCLLLLVVVCIIGVTRSIAFLQTGESQPFFETVYTALIFADITLVLLTQRCMPAFNAVFRNSGFVVGTLMMRLSLSATSPLDTLIALFSAGYVILLVWAFSHFLSGGKTGAEPDAGDKNSPEAR